MDAEHAFQVGAGVRGRRFIALDERGVGLRATWHASHGFVNLSLWKGDRCVETFHLTPEAASELMAFVMRALASSIPAPSHPPLSVVSGSNLPKPPSGGRDLLSSVRRRFADDLTALARRVRP